MGLAATQEQHLKMMRLIVILDKWNRFYNLTSIASQADRVRLHLLDSLAILPYLKGQRVLDVGTGAGFPGLPLAILSPDKDFTLLDSNAKKTRFVRQAAIELGLPNVHVQHARIEQYTGQSGFDSILARAFSSLADIVSNTSRLLNPGGVILAQKGKLPQDEINTLPHTFIQVFKLAVPGIDAERHLIVIKVQG